MLKSSLMDLDLVFSVALLVMAPVDLVSLHYTPSIFAEDKLSSMEQYPLTRVRRRESDKALNAVENSAFM